MEAHEWTLTPETMKKEAVPVDFGRFDHLKINIMMLAD